jgi:hypothetical protein
VTQRSTEKLEYTLATLWQETGQAHFLHTLSMPEMLAALEKRCDLMEHLLAQLNREAMSNQHTDPASLVMLDHYYTMLHAELNWLQRTIRKLHSQLY